MKVGFVPLALAASAICLAAAAPSQSESVHFTTSLDGASEVPPNTTAGKGTLNADLDTATGAFSYTITYSGLTGPAVAAHFHGPAGAGVNAPPVIPIKDLADPIKGSAVLTPGQMGDLRAGKWYFNLHTKAHPPGEIRGQLIAP
jgi:hypothetical protein